MTESRPAPPAAGRNCPRPEHGRHRPGTGEHGATGVGPGPSRSGCRPPAPRRAARRGDRSSRQLGTSRKGTANSPHESVMAPYRGQNVPSPCPKDRSSVTPIGLAPLASLRPRVLLRPPRTHARRLPCCWPACPRRDGFGERRSVLVSGGYWLLTTNWCSTRGRYGGWTVPTPSSSTAAVLLTGEKEAARTVLVRDVDQSEAEGRLHTLFDRTAASALRTREGWTVGRLSDLSARDGAAAASPPPWRCGDPRPHVQREPRGGLRRT